MPAILATGELSLKVSMVSELKKELSVILMDQLFNNLTLFCRLLNVKGLYSSIGCNIALLEYRGYGRSEGSPSEEGIYMDAQAGLDFLLTREDLATDKIIVFGRSLGGAVAVDLATRWVPSTESKNRI